MKLVIVKQESGKYIFLVPENRNIVAGTSILLDTSRGKQVGMAVCDSFYCEKETAEAIMKAFNTSEKQMKYVIGRVSYDMFEQKAEQT